MKRWEVNVQFSGFVLPSAIFLLVILAGLAAFLVNISMTQNITSAQDVQSARAYQAARAGLEWGLYHEFDPSNSTVTAMVSPYGTGPMAWPNLPVCPTDKTLTIEGFAVAVSCIPSDYSEAGLNRRIRVFLLKSRASLGTVGTATFVEREVAVTAIKCRALDGAAPDYACP
jgi:MSHA biogenesis protein MshP